MSPAFVAGLLVGALLTLFVLVVVGLLAYLVVRWIGDLRDEPEWVGL